MSTIIIGCCDPLAQLAEHLTFNQGVRGSNPRWVTKNRQAPFGACRFYFFTFLSSLFIKIKLSIFGKEEVKVNSEKVRCAPMAARISLSLLCRIGWHLYCCDLPKIPDAKAFGIFPYSLLPIHYSLTAPSPFGIFPSSFRTLLFSPSSSSRRGLGKGTASRERRKGPVRPVAAPIRTRGQTETLRCPLPFSSAVHPRWAIRPSPMPSHGGAVGGKTFTKAAGPRRGLPLFSQDGGVGGTVPRRAPIPARRRRYTAGSTGLLPRSAGRGRPAR